MVEVGRKLETMNYYIPELPLEEKWYRTRLPDSSPALSRMLDLLASSLESRITAGRLVAAEGSY